MSGYKWFVRSMMWACLAASVGPAQAQSANGVAESGGRAYLALGGAAPDADALNRRLSSSGHPTIAETVPTIGAGGHAVMNRWIVGAEGHAFIVPEKAAMFGSRHIERSVRAASAFADVGYLILKRSNLHVYPLIGIGGGGMELRFSDRSPGSFDEVLANPRQTASLTVGGFLIQAAVGIERFLVLGGRDTGWGVTERGVTFGIRAGYVFGPLQSDWKLQGTTASNGPDIAITGPYVRVVIGAGTRRAIR